MNLREQILKEYQGKDCTNIYDMSQKSYEALTSNN